jgi:hypothetical protein
MLTAAYIDADKIDQVQTDLLQSLLAGPFLRLDAAPKTNSNTKKKSNIGIYP